jgi:hypothetical protein
VVQSKKIEVSGKMAGIQFWGLKLYLPGISPIPAALIYPKISG